MRILPFRSRGARARAAPLARRPRRPHRNPPKSRRIRGRARAWRGKRPVARGEEGDPDPIPHPQCALTRPPTRTPSGRSARARARGVRPARRSNPRGARAKMRARPESRAGEGWQDTRRARGCARVAEFFFLPRPVAARGRFQRQRAALPREGTEQGAPRHSARFLTDPSLCQRAALPALPIPARAPGSPRKTMAAAASRARPRAAARAGARARRAARRAAARAAAPLPGAEPDRPSLRTQASTALTCQIRSSSAGPPGTNYTVMKKVRGARSGARVRARARGLARSPPAARALGLPRWRALARAPWPRCALLPRTLTPRTYRAGCSRAACR